MPELHTHYRPGGWTLHVRGDSWLLMSPSADDEFTLQLWNSLGDRLDGRSVMACLMDHYGAFDLPGFAYATATPDGFDVWVRATARATCDGTVLTPDEGAPWVSRRLSGTRLVLTTSEVDESRAQSLMPLLGGVVLADLVVAGSGSPAGVESTDVVAQGGEFDRGPANAPEPVLSPPPGEGFDLLLRGMSPHRGPSTAPVDELVVAAPGLEPEPQPVPHVDETAEDSTRVWDDEGAAPATPEAPTASHPQPDPAVDPEPTPEVQQTEGNAGQLPPRTGEAEVQTVLAARCPAGHWTPAFAPLCRVCRVPVPAQSGVSIQRPHLGILRLANGDTIDLDRGAILGRAPQAITERPERRNLITLAAFGRDISRAHAEIVLDGWHVLIQDLGSANGTRLTTPGGEPEQLTPYELYAIEPDSTLEIAEVTTIRYEALGADQTQPDHEASWSAQARPERGDP